jgi:hypothetical protein
MCYLINVSERKRKMRDKMGAISKRLAAAQAQQQTTVKNNDLIVSVQREFINASDFNSVDEYRAAVKARRAAIEAHNAQIRQLGR